jgi:hypothetical protein
MKTCITCALDWPLTEFYPHKTNLDGLNGQCKSCCRKYDREYQKGRGTNRSKKRLASRAAYRNSEKGKRTNRTYRQSEHYRRLVAKANVERRKRNVEEINKIKLSRGCVDCGYNLHPAALDFDHRPGERKRFGVSYAKQRTMNIIRKEMEKCDVVCANCHRVRTEKRRQAKEFI